MYIKWGSPMLVGFAAAQYLNWVSPIDFLYWILMIPEPNYFVARFFCSPWDGLVSFTNGQIDISFEPEVINTPEEIHVSR